MSFDELNQADTLPRLLPYKSPSAEVHDFFILQVHVLLVFNRFHTNSITLLFRPLRLLSQVNFIDILPVF